MASGVPDEIFTNSSPTTVSYSDIEGGFTGSGNIDADPLFLNPAIDNYRLQPGSPCIDAANSDNPAPASDKDGNLRYDDPATSDTGSGANGGYYDIGAYEFMGVACTDGDSDGYYAEVECGGPETDCNDSDVNINPSATEVCGDGADNDGDGDVDCLDTDCAGDPACGGGCVPSPEICDDGVDNDCDGKIDCADKKDCRTDPAC